MEALHQPVGVRAEHERLARVPEGAGPLRDELGSLLAPVPDRAGAKAVEGREEIDDEVRHRYLPCAHCEQAPRMFRKTREQTQTHRTPQDGHASRSLTATRRHTVATGAHILP